MKNIIKKTPVPIAGVMLGMAALGNLIQSYSENLRLLFGVISATLGILLILKVIMYPKAIKEDFKNPIMASVSGTFSMAIMLLAAYLKPLMGSAAIFIWYLGIVLHIVLIMYFTMNFIFKFNIKKVFASYFIVYVGIVAGSITAPAFEKKGLGQAFFYFGFISLIILLGVVGYRYIKYKEIPEPAQPLICIFAAPASLCLAGYIQSFDTKSKTFIMVLAVVSLAIYIFTLIELPKLLKLKFYPSYSAFTFPFIISGIAMKQTMVVLSKMEINTLLISYIVAIQTIIAIALTINVLILYIKFLTAKPLDKSSNIAKAN